MNLDLNNSTNANTNEQAVEVRRAATSYGIFILVADAVVGNGKPWPVTFHDRGQLEDVMIPTSRSRGCKPTAESCHIYRWSMDQGKSAS